MSIKFQALPTEIVRKLQAGAPDANGQVPERQISNGGGNPCRHCLEQIPEGEEMLVLGYRPFPGLQPYAEVGPIFLCAKPCARHPETGDAPPILDNKEEILMRGYTRDDRILYGTGKVIPVNSVQDAAEAMFGNEDVAYIHLRSASNNCYQVRIERD